MFGSTKVPSNRTVGSLGYQIITRTTSTAIAAKDISNVHAAPAAATAADDRAPRYQVSVGYSATNDRKALFVPIWWARLSGLPEGAGSEF